ncbi:hypothetical protein CJ030_MR6G029217 [Morella rubra]|uniref:Uncharacterized protein n=1 Tax=Morella rubra TaxID=262757 RepID=A0A6A1VA46_9ROSI|nr:hypothetical protein CJ030_MR6G029217 [Morella rubra]
MLRIRRHSSRMLFAASNIMGYYTNGGSSGCYSTIRSDPITLLLSKGCQLNTLSPKSCSTFVSGRGRGRGGIAVDIGFNGNNLKLKGCLREDDIDAVAFHKGKGKGNGKGNHPRSFAPPHLQLLRVRHFEIGLQESTSTTDDATAAVIQNQQGASHHGSPLGLTDRPLPNKIVVAVDVDEVLGNFVSALNRFIADRYFSKHSISEYHVYEFFKVHFRGFVSGSQKLFCVEFGMVHADIRLLSWVSHNHVCVTRSSKIWNCSRDEADIRVHEFFKTSYFKKGIHPIPGARRALHKLSSLCNLSVVTSRQNAIKDHTIDWIERHYPGLFQEIHFGNHFALDGVSRSKSEICRYVQEFSIVSPCS